jgi:chromosome segregation ATPase
MATDPTAEIIPFPAAFAPDRLTRALAKLEEALAAQHDAVTQWRGKLEALRGAVGGIERSLHSYGNELASLQGSVTRLREASERLAK